MIYFCFKKQSRFDVLDQAFTPINPMAMMNAYKYVYFNLFFTIFISQNIMNMNMNPNIMGMMGQNHPQTNMNPMVPNQFNQNMNLQKNNMSNLPPQNFGQNANNSQNFAQNNNILQQPSLVQSYVLTGNPQNLNLNASPQEKPKTPFDDLTDLI
jgi:hypothetical protein